MGAVTATQYTAAKNQDIMRVQLPDPQISNDIILRDQDVEGQGNPQTGEPVCAMLGRSGYENCGWVFSAHASWTGDACGCVMRGAKVEGFYPVQGDSGSPVYRLTSTAAYGIGLINKGAPTGRGHVFIVRLKDALDVWNYSVYTVD